MELKHIHIRGFKSIEDVIFEPATGFSCLVGSNGAGKSNFCDALIFFKNVITNGVSSAIQEVGDKSILTDNEIVSFSLEIQNNGEIPVNYLYKTSINVQDEKIIDEEFYGANNLIYSRKSGAVEKLNIEKAVDLLTKIKIDFAKFTAYEKSKTKSPKNKKNNKPDLDLDLDLDINSILKVFDKHYSWVEKDTDKLNADKTGLSSYYANEDIYSYIKNLNVFRINPLVPKMPTKIFNTSNLLIHGDNLATILLELQKDVDKWDTLHDLLSLIVPSVNSVTLNRGDFDEQLSLHFTENQRTFPAICISDGTIYTLAILTAILWNKDKHSLIIIEEPERGIHPQAIGELISFIKNIVLEKTMNVIVTTHSETVVRNCTLEELWLVDKIDGHTKLKNAKQSSPHVEESSLDQAWLMNLLNGGLPW